MRGPSFYSKILLFGEYGIIRDSKGLSIPYNFYNGALKTSHDLNALQTKSNEHLKDFADYLSQLDTDFLIKTKFDLRTFKTDIAKGLYFDSSIPQGYGIGSSGALVAAVYDQYAREKITILENLTREKLVSLKKIFSEMESFFHGKSSGLDPLNSYLSLPLLINSQENIEMAGLPSQNESGKGAVFLLDSGTVGETAPLVNIFMENLKHEGFRKMLKEKFIKHTDACIEDFLQGDIKSLLGNVKKLSNIVLDNFKPMIPKAFVKLWQKGIESNDYYLKLCGSGGGGYILGFAPDFKKAQKALKNYKLEVVYNF